MNPSGPVRSALRARKNPLGPEKGSRNSVVELTENAFFSGTHGPFTASARSTLTTPAGNEFVTTNNPVAEKEAIWKSDAPQSGPLKRRKSQASFFMLQRDIFGDSVETLSGHGRMFKR